MDVLFLARYHAGMARSLSSGVSSDRAVSAMVERFRSALAEKERMPQREELVQLIESGKHVLIGAKALAYYTRPRFTQDTDYVVSGQTFARIRKWMSQNNVDHEDLGLVLRFHSLALDVIDGRSNDVLKEILKREGTVPGLEALATAKYVSMINPQRAERRLQDASDFAALVVLKDFDLHKLRTYLVGPYAEQWPEVQKLIDDIKAGRPITI